MNVKKTGGKTQAAARRVSLWLVAQLLLTLVTVVVVVVVGQKIRPLIARKQALETEIRQMQVQRAYLAFTLDSLARQVDELSQTLQGGGNEPAQRELSSLKAGLSQAQALATVPDSATIPARLYIHIRDEQQRPAAKRAGEQVKAAGFVVPGIERMVDKGPQVTELRYFRKADEAEAKRLQTVLQRAGVAVRLSDLSASYENSKSIRPGHFELWFAPGDIELQPRKLKR